MAETQQYISYLGSYDASMKLADMHVHTTNSDGIWGVRKYLYEAQKRGLSGIVFTDHDDIRTGYEAREIAARENIPLEIIPAVEVSAKGVHIFAFHVEDNIPMYKDLFTTAEIILKNGGTVGFPHPEYTQTDSASHKDILTLAQQGVFPAVEVFNASIRDVRSIPWKKHIVDSNALTREFYEENKDILGAPLSGTDSHFRTVGRGLVAYKGSLADAIADRQTSVVFSSQYERLFPWDILTHQMRLKRMERKREVRYASEELVAFAVAD